MLRNSLGDADGERDLSLESLLDTGGGQRGAWDGWSVLSGGIIERIYEGRIRDEKSSGGGSSLLDGFGDVLEDGQVEMCLASLLGVCATNNLGS